MTDAVNHPSHYTSGKIEVIDFIEDQKLDMHTGNAVKYIARAGKKNPEKEVEDLEKSIWYLQRKVNNLKSARQAEADANSVVHSVPTTFSAPGDPSVLDDDSRPRIGFQA